MSEETGSTKRRGRPHKSSEGRGQKVMTYLPPEVVEWLKNQPEGISQTIAKLVREQMKSEDET